MLENLVNRLIGAGSKALGIGGLVLGSMVPVNAQGTTTQIEGDVDGNGNVTLGDASLALSHAEGYEFLNDACKEERGDTDSDGEVTYKDVQQIIRYALGFESALVYESKVCQPDDIPPDDIPTDVPLVAWSGGSGRVTMSDINGSFIKHVYIDSEDGVSHTAYSPDKKYLVALVGSTFLLKDNLIAMIDVNSGEWTNITPTAALRGMSRQPWLPDGRLVIAEGYDFYVMNVDGSGKERITNTSDYERLPVVSASTGTIAYVTSDKAGSFNSGHNGLGKDVMVLDSLDGTPIEIDKSFVNVVDPDMFWSSDGRYLVYDTNSITSPINIYDSLEDTVTATAGRDDVDYLSIDYFNNIIWVQDIFGDFNTHIYTKSISGGEEMDLIEGRYPAPAPDGSIIYLGVEFVSNMHKINRDGSDDTILSSESSGTNTTVSK